MKATNFDEHFDNGGSVMPHADMTKAERPNLIRRVNVDFPSWMVEALDKESKRLGITRQSLVKVWVADCLARGSQSGHQA